MTILLVEDDADDIFLMQRALKSAGINQRVHLAEHGLQALEYLMASNLAATEVHKWPLSALVPDILQHLDVPDCYQALAAKRLSLLQPVRAAQSVP